MSKHKITFPSRFALIPHPRPGRCVFNAPRPLPGAEMWEGEPIEGTHYCTVDLTIPEAAKVLQEVADLGAVCLAYVSEEACVSRVYAESKRSGRQVNAYVSHDRIVRDGLSLLNRAPGTYTVEVEG